MPYGKFESVSEVARIFDIEVSANKPFVDKLKIEVPNSDFNRIEKKLADDLNFINETGVTVVYCFRQMFFSIRGKCFFSKNFYLENFCLKRYCV